MQVGSIVGCIVGCEGKVLPPQTNPLPIETESEIRYTSDEIADASNVNPKVWISRLCYFCMTADWKLSRARSRLRGSLERPRPAEGKAAMKASYRLPQLLSLAVDFRE